MKKKEKYSHSVSAKQINSLFTNVQNLGKEEGSRYDAGFLYFCIDQLKKRHGQSKRYIMCKLIECGLESHPLYASEYDSLKRMYEKEAAGGGVPDGLCGVCDS